MGKQNKKGEEMDNMKILQKADELGQLWLEAARWDGKHDINAALNALCGRRGPDNEPVLALVVRDPSEVLRALSYGVALLEGYTVQGSVNTELRQQVSKQNVKIKRPRKLKSMNELKKRVKDLEPSSCLWEYYRMAFYESAMQASGLSHYLTDQSLLPAFTAGVGHIVNLGTLVVGVLQAEAHTDERMLLHRESGPAILWGDTEQCWWHGTQVPAEWITDPDSVDVVELLRWDNTEQRRAGCEIIGWERVLDKLKPKIVDADSDPEIGTLMQVDLPEAPGSQFLKVRCGTGRDFVLPVPETVSTALEANAWTYDLSTDEYKKLEFRT